MLKIKIQITADQNTGKTTMINEIVNFFVKYPQSRLEVIFETRQNESQDFKEERKLIK